MRKRTAFSPAVLCLALLGTLVLPAMPAAAVPAETPPAAVPAEPPAVDPGEPAFTGSATPIPPEPVGYQPRGNMLRAVYDADVAAGGESYWFDRILARPFLSD